MYRESHFFFEDPSPSSPDIFQIAMLAMAGVTSRISAACRRVAATDALSARTRDTLNNPNALLRSLYYIERPFWSKRKIAQAFGSNHVMFVDGYSRFICGAIILPVKDPILIYYHLFRPILLCCGLVDQNRTDHGQGFSFRVFVRELFKECRFDKRRMPWSQTQCTQNYVAERMWPEINQRINYPVKRVSLLFRRKKNSTLMMLSQKN